jgi:hypothetical protein
MEMNANVLDEVRFVRPVPPGAGWVRTVARRVAVIGAVYVAFAAAGSAAVALTCALPSSVRPVVLGVAVTAAISFGAQKWRSAGARPPVPQSIGELTPVLLLYAHNKIAKTALELERPHDYVCAAFKRLLDRKFEIVNARSMKTALYATIDELIARDTAKRRKA